MFIVYQSNVVNLNNIVEFKIAGTNTEIIRFVGSQQQVDFYFQNQELAKFIFDEIIRTIPFGYDVFDCDNKIKFSEQYEKK